MNNKPSTMNRNQLIQLLETLKTDVINSMQANGKDATGQTAKQITIEADGNSAQLQFPDYIQALETGRRPTSKDAVTRIPPMIQRIQQWCRAKGIPDKAAWAIKKSIDKNGYKGVPGILTQPLGDDNINIRLNPVLDAMMATAIRDILKSID